MKTKDVILNEKKNLTDNLKLKFNEKLKKLNDKKLIKK